MSDEPEHLNNEFFQHLASKLPGLKKQYAEAKGKKLMEAGMLAKTPCCACGKFHGAADGKIIQANSTPKPYCKSCQKALDDGYTLFVTADNKRFSFNKFPNAPAEYQALMAGKVITVDDARMDKILHRDKPENN